MEVMKKIFYRRFSKNEYKQLRTILSEETKVVLKRPQYIIGHVLIIGMLFYFLVMAFGPESFGEFEWPRTADVVGIVVGTAVGTCIFWLGLKLFKVLKGNDLKFAVIFFGFWMIAFGLLTAGQRHSGTRIQWEFAIYAALTFFGWLFCTGSIKEHFCERIFMSQKESKQADSVA